MELLPISDLTQLRFLPDGAQVWAHFYMPEDTAPSMQGPLLVKDVVGGKQLYWIEPGAVTAFGPVISFEQDLQRGHIIHHGQLRAELFQDNSFPPSEADEELLEYVAAEREQYVARAAPNADPFPIDVRELSRPNLTIIDYGVHVDIFATARGFILRVGYHEGVDSFVVTRFRHDWTLATAEQAPGTWLSVAPVLLHDEEELSELLTEISTPIAG